MKNGEGFLQDAKAENSRAVLQTSALFPPCEAGSRAQSRRLLPPPSAWFKAKPSLHLQLVKYQKKINAQGVTKRFLIADRVITAIPPDLLFSAVQRASVG